MSVVVFVLELARFDDFTVCTARRFRVLNSVMNIFQTVDGRHKTLGMKNIVCIGQRGDDRFGVGVRQTGPFIIIVAIHLHIRTTL